MKQAQLARLANTTPQTIGKLEDGRMNLTLDWMRRLGKALDVPAAALLADEDAEPRLAPAEYDIVQAYRQLEPRERGRFLRVCAVLAAPLSDNGEPATMDEAIERALQRREQRRAASAA